MSNTTDTPIPLSPPSPLRSDTLADSVLILLGLTAVQRLIGFARSLLFCRWLNAEQLGQWDMAFNFLLLAAPLSVLALSGSFPRYVEYYRQRCQLRSFLKRTSSLYACCAILSVGFIWLGRGWFSQLIFGGPGREEMVSLLAGCLLAVIVYHFFLELFIGLRNIRIVSGLQFLQSFAFAVLGICLLLSWQCTAASVLAAYGGASLVVSVGAIWWWLRTWHLLPEDAQPPAHRDLWSKLLPFAAWIWIANLMANLFEIADRYMLVHFSPLPPAEALARVGEYHSSRVLPLLLVSIAMMLGSVITPHLSHDWEQGRRERVAARLNLLLKLIGFGLSAAAVAVLFAAPLVFDVAFQGKFSAGLAILPWTLTYCIWFGISAIAQSYLWCAEKARLASVALLVGLVTNIALNLLLLPRLGLLGAVLATTVANLVALLLIAAFNHLLGFRMHRGTWVVLAMPPVVCLGPWAALVVLIAIAVEAVRHDRLFSPEEKRQLATGVMQYWERFRGLRLGPKSAGSTSQ